MDNKPTYDELLQRIKELEGKISSARSIFIEHETSGSLYHYMLEKLEKIDQAIKQATDTEEMLENVLKAVYQIFGCDRAWLLYPCDPDAASFRVPAEITNPEFPGAKELNLEVKMSPTQAEDLRAALASEIPLMYGDGTGNPLSTGISGQFNVKTQMFMAIYPKVDKPWLFGIHQCSHHHVWTKKEQDLFKEVGRRISDGLASALTLRKLKESEQHFRAMFEQASIGVALCNSQTGKYLKVNDEYSKIVGYPVEDLYQMSFHEISHPDDLKEDLNKLQLMVDGKISDYKIEKRYFRQDGSVIWGKLSVSPMWQEGGMPGFHIATLEDITERKSVEDELRSHIYLLENLDRIDKIIRGGTNADQVMAEVMEEVLEIFNCDRAWLLYPCDPDSPSWSIPIEKTRPEYPGAFVKNIECPMTEDAAEAMKQVLSTKEPVHGILKPGEPEYDKNNQFNIKSYLITAVYPKIGKPWEFGLHQCAYERKWNSKEISLFKGISNKIGDALSILLVLKNLQENERRYRSIMEASPDPIVTYDMEGDVIYLNPAFTRVFGWTIDELAGKKIDYVPKEAWPETQAMINKLKRGEEFSGFKTSRYNKNGELIDIDMSCGVWKDESDHPIGSIVILRDITEQKKVADQLNKAQKLEAIGTLAGGIAHDFNNILSGIFGFSQLAKIHLKDPEKAEKDIDQIQKGGEKAMDLVQQILAISRQAPDKKYPCGIHLIVKEALKLLRATIPTTIEIRETIHTKAKVMANATKIHQIIMNLGTNAYHAMQETGGVLSVSLKQVVFSKKDNISELNVKPGKYIKLEVSDTGSGIDASAMLKIYDPYFTTKEVGKGTGLGLAVVLGIVEEHKGSIKAFSEPEQGTTFHVYLPVLEKVSDPEPEKDQDQIRLTGSERILFVDDEVPVLQATKELLEEFDYSVDAFSDGKKALEAFRKTPDQFDLVITDMTMPGMTGLELAQNLFKLRPEQPVILCTGLRESILRKRADAIGIRAYIEKPIITRNLTQVIRSVLDAGKANDSQN